jgi:phage gpG-like protein
MTARWDLGKMTQFLTVLSGSVLALNTLQPEAPIPSHTPGQVAAALADLPIAETLTTALDAAATRLAGAVRAELATPPGGPHDQPWIQTGALQASITHTTTGLTAQIGSNDPAAAPQEQGTATIAPRPFLAPAAAALAEPIAHDIATTLTSLLARAIN